MKLLFLLPLLALACSIYVPTIDTQKFVNCPFDPDLMRQSIHDFEDEYVEKFQLNEDDSWILHRSLSDITVECRKGDTVTFDWYGEEHTALAVTLSPDYVLMSVQDGLSLGRSSFFHELVHVVLWNLQGDPDPDHLGDKYSGWEEEHEELIFELRTRYLFLE